MLKFCIAIAAFGLMSTTVCAETITRKTKQGNSVTIKAATSFDNCVRGGTRRLHYSVEEARAYCGKRFPQ